MIKHDALWPISTVNAMLMFDKYCIYFNFQQQTMITIGDTSYDNGVMIGSFRTFPSRIIS